MSRELHQVMPRRVKGGYRGPFRRQRKGYQQTKKGPFLQSSLEEVFQSQPVGAGGENPKQVRARPLKARTGSPARSPNARGARGKRGHVGRDGKRKKRLSSSKKQRPTAPGGGVSRKAGGVFGEGGRSQRRRPAHFRGDGGR